MAIKKLIKPEKQSELISFFIDRLKSLSIKQTKENKIWIPNYSAISQLGADEIIKKAEGFNPCSFELFIENKESYNILKKLFIKEKNIQMSIEDCYNLNTRIPKFDLGLVLIDKVTEYLGELFVKYFFSVNSTGEIFIAFNSDLLSNEIMINAIRDQIEHRYLHQIILLSSNKKQRMVILCLSKKAVEKDYVEIFDYSQNKSIETIRRLDLINLSNYLLLEILTESAKNKVPLKDLAEIYRGVYFPENMIIKGKGDFYFLKVINIRESETQHIENEYELQFSNEKDDSISIKDDSYKAKLEENQNHIFLKEGDIVLSSRGSEFKYAKVGKYKKPLILSSNLIVIRCKESLNPDFLLFILSQEKTRKNFESKYKVEIKKSIELKKKTNKTVNGLTDYTTKILSISPENVQNFKIPSIQIEQQESIIKEYSKIRNRFIEAKNQFLNNKENLFTSI